MKIRAKITAFLATTVLALSAAGCGLTGGGDDDEAKAADAGCDGDKVSYQLSFIPNPQQVGFLYAYDKGYFKDEGLDLKMKAGGPTVNPALQVAQGNVDVAELPLGDAMNAVSKGAEVKLVAQIDQQTPLRYISWKDVPLSTPEELKGTTVGVQQAGNLAPTVQTMIGKVGLSADEIEIKQIAFDVSDFIAKKVDVFPLRTYAHIAMLEEQDVSYPEDVNVLNPADFGADLPETGIYANSAYLDSNANVVTCMLRAIKSGWTDALANPDEAKKAVGKFAPAAAFSKEAIDVDVDEMLVVSSQTGDGKKVEALTTDMKYLQQGADSLREVGEVPEDVVLEDMVDLGPLEKATSGN